MIKQIREVVSPWWNTRLARARFHRVAEFLDRSGSKFAPVVYDVGARWGISTPFDRLQTLQGLQSVGFEPDPEEASKLAAANAFTITCPVALGRNEEERTLYIAREPGCSSLFPPNAAEIARHAMDSRFDTVREIRVETVPMDLAIQRFGLPRPHMLKIDCEGAEGEIIDGAEAAMQGVCGITFEARFREFYKGGSVFGDLVKKLYDRGYVTLRLNPAGDFKGALMMFDVSMVRHPDNLGSAEDLIASVLFCLIHDNWRYALHLAKCREADFGLQGLSGLLER
jgi:FkbM family methyltransferase